MLNNISSPIGAAAFGVPPALAVALDAPVTAALVSSTQLAFGFDRLVQGYTGNTVRLQRSSDSAQADFGFDPKTGIFNLSAALSWGRTDTLTVVRFFDQNSTGKTLDANTATSVAFVASGVATRFATTWSNVDGQLTQSTAQGGVGCTISGGGYFTLSSSSINVSAAGAEFHVLAASLARKKANATVDPAAFSANGTSETLFSYGTGSSNYFRVMFGGGTAPGLMRRLGTGSGGTDQNLSINPGVIKKNAQFAVTGRIDATEVSYYGYGKKVQTAATSAGNVTANASMNNGQFRVGESFATGAAGNILFGGIIVTTTLADRDRTYIHAALNAIGQQHRRKKVSDLLAYFDEIIDARDVDGNGLIAGRNGKMSIQFNKTVGAPTFNFAYTVPVTGWTGIRSPSNTNTDNTYKAVAQGYFTDVLSGSVMTVCANENITLNQTWQLRADADNSNFSLGMGRHHASPDFYHRISAAWDTQGWASHLYSADGADGGGGKISQAMCKYQFNLVNGEWNPGSATTATITSVLYGVTINIGTTLDTATAATVGWNYPVPEEIYASETDLVWNSAVGELLYHIATFQKGANYNVGDPEATRRLYMRTATNYSYCATPDVPIGHRDASIAFENGTGSIVQSDSTFRIQSGNYQGDVNMGTHLLWLFGKTVWTQAQVEEIQVNLYKLIYQGYS